MIDAQRTVERFARRHGLRYDVVTQTLDLVSEVGELAKLVLQANAYGREPLDEEVDFSGELGDVVYSLLALATAMEVEAADALDDALRKYDRRVNERGGPGSV